MLLKFDRDIRSEAAASDWRDCRNSETGQNNVLNNVEGWIKDYDKFYENEYVGIDNRPGLVLTRLEASAVLEKYRVELLEKLC